MNTIYNKLIKSPFIAGYGDIHAHTTGEEIIAIVVFLIGLLLFGYCLSNIAAILTNKLSHKVQFKGKIFITSLILKSLITATNFSKLTNSSETAADL